MDKNKTQKNPNPSRSLQKTKTHYTISEFGMLNINIIYIKEKVKEKME